MGCCVSTNKASTSPQSPRKDHAVVAEPPTPSERSIAPPHAEEERVKEVLSETPKWKNPATATKSEPQKPPQNMAFHKLQEEEEEEEEGEGEEEENKDEKKALLVNKAQEEETSEVCSLMSETMSISTTTTTTELKEEEAEQTRKRVIRSPSKLRKNRSFSGIDGGKRERKVHASRNGVVGSARLVQCRDQVGQTMVNGGTRTQPRWRNPSETSFRRSKSPATSAAGDGAANSVLGRCPSARRTNRTPVTPAVAALPENGCRKMEVPGTEGKGGCAKETLENPLVSLECFIFI